MWFYFCAPQHHVEEPDDETVGQEDERGNEHWSMKNQSMPDMPDLERNQSRRREDHQKFGPAFLHINANPFGKEDRAIKEGEGRRRAQHSAGEHVLQFVEQIGDVLAVMEEQ